MARTPRTQLALQAVHERLLDQELLERTAFVLANDLQFPAELRPVRQR